MKDYGAKNNEAPIPVTAPTRYRDSESGLLSQEPVKHGGSQAGKHIEGTKCFFKRMFLMGK